MNDYVAFLRGMNLGGRRIKNDELRNEFELLGYADVACFRASGNVIFGSEESDEAKLTARIEAGLGEALGYEVPVFLRNVAELRSVAAREAFDASFVAASQGKLQVAFLLAAPSKKKSREALDLSSDEDRLAIDGRELCWLPSGGVSESDLDLKAIESILGLWTMRTKGTIDQIAARFFAQ
ncbi:MAG TPA: DUF1697 domain-containing protein [Solirubrobacterales bacterium]|jgi:uncharacterized protein (DUF1697 family)|nr:DUF1697 domain-containing protein [Solirubrobacterales bacterium]